jgi:indole-3-glycerol phosphate synthase
MSYLDKILDATRVRIQSTKKQMPLRELESNLKTKEAPRDFLGSVTGQGVSLIAEFKRRSPSAGAINEAVEPAQIVSAYEEGGASALSILTDPDFFSGSMKDLGAAKVASSLPVLRKDFVIDSYQITEARAYGADAVLLIVAALDDGLLRELRSSIEEYEMTALIEVHDEAELDRAMALDPSLIGVNQRDLKTFEVDTSLAPRLRKLIPENVVVVAESGIKSRADVELLESAGLEAMLVGEHLMREGDIVSATAELLGRKA